MIGSTVKSDGTAIASTSGKVPVQVGITSGNVVEYFGRDIDKDGNVVSYEAGKGRYRITIKQACGATLNQLGFEPKPEWATAIDIFNQQMAHICCRVISEDDYKNLGEEAGGDFNKFFELIEQRVLPLLKKAKWHVKMVLTEREGQYYPKLAKYPNFIELDNGTPATTLSNSLAKGESFTVDYSKVKAPTEAAAENAENPFN